MKIIPALDIINGKCVRLSKGDYETQKIYSENPLEIAKEFENHGIQYLHLVDLDGAKSKTIKNLKILESIASETNLIVDFGGGIKSKTDLENAFNAGANQVTIGSFAVENPAECEEWLRVYGGEKLILGADCLDRKIKTSGWLIDSAIEVIDFLKAYEQKGFRQVICTDISKDGMLQGPSFQLYEEIINQVDMKLIASGGISSIQDLHGLKSIGCYGAIVGKAFYEGKIYLTELSNFK